MQWHSSSVQTIYKDCYSIEAIGNDVIYMANYVTKIFIAYQT